MTVESSPPGSLPWYDTRTFMQQRYGAVLHRIPVDAGRGCPHRDAGGGGGCTFCPPDGARAVQLGDAGGLEEQVGRAVAFARRRYGAKRFLGYVQAYTGTWASIETQREQYERLLSLAEFDVLSVGTRPDCLDDATLDLLQAFAQRLDVWVELGVQTCHDRTLRLINRGHDWECSRRAVERLAARGVRPVAHLILGLPGEGREAMRTTVRTLSQLPLGGVKLHNLHLVEGSVLAASWRRDPFPLLEDLEYIDLLAELLALLPADVPVLRVRTDTPAERLVAPTPELSKGEFLQALAEHMRRRGMLQGAACSRGDCAPVAISEGERGEVACVSEVVPTRDGSVTLWNPDFKEHYHSKYGARSEAREKYVEPSGLVARLTAGGVRLLDLCFGMGYNALTASEAAVAGGVAGELSVTAMELDARVVRRSADVIRRLPEDRLDWAALLRGLAADGRVDADGVGIRMLWGDARLSLRRCSNCSFDLVFHDPFSTQRCAELWTVELFEELHRVLAPGGSLWTYSVAVPVRSGLLAAGFSVGETRDGAGRGVGTHAVKLPGSTAFPLPDRVLSLIQDTARGVPYRDPPGCWSNRRILAERQRAVDVGRI